MRSADAVVTEGQGGARAVPLSGLAWQKCVLDNTLQ